MHRARPVTFMRLRASPWPSRHGDVLFSRNEHKGLSAKTDGLFSISGGHGRPVARDVQGRLLFGLQESSKFLSSSQILPTSRQLLPLYGMHTRLRIRGRIARFRFGLALSLGRASFLGQRRMVTLGTSPYLWQQDSMWPLNRSGVVSLRQPLTVAQSAMDSMRPRKREAVSVFFLPNGHKNSDKSLQRGCHRLRSCRSLGNAY